MFLIAGLLLAALSVASGQAKVPSSNETGEAEQLLQIERDLDRALTQGDMAAIDRMVADDVSGVDAVGHVLDKKHLINNVNSKDLTEDSLDLEGMQVRIYGNAAFVIGILKDKNGQIQTTHFTDVFVKREKTWKLVHWQWAAVDEQ
jgi:hypothetical protein